MSGIQGEDAAERVVDGLNMATMGTPTYSGTMIDGKVVAESSEQGHAGRARHEDTGRSRRQ